MNRLQCGLVGLLWLMLFGGGSAWAQSGGGAQHVTAKLLSDVSSFAADRPFQVGLLLTIDPGWHVYWKNPGDSGSPTRVTWKLPPGFTADPVQFPVPTRLTAPGDVVNFGYENEVMLIARIHPAPQLMQQANQDVSVSAELRYLVCNSEICLPGSAKLAIVLPSAAVETPAPSAGELFRHWSTLMPRRVDPDDVSGVSCDMQLGESGSKARATVRIQWNAAVPQDIAFFPEPVPGFDLSEIKVSSTGLTSTCSYLLSSPQNALLPPTLDTVVAFTLQNQPRVGLAVPVPSINRQDMPPPVAPASP